MTVIVYEKPNCQACRATKRWLDQHNVEYVVADITEENVLTEMKARGFMEAPVVMVGEEGWSGFRPDKLSTLLY